MKTKIVVRRLKNTPEGRPYGVDTATTTSENEATALVDKWWASGGTMVLTVTIGEKEEARYTKQYADPRRYPEGWGGESTDRTRFVPSEVQEEPTPEPIPLTLGDQPETPAQPGPAQGGCPCCYRVREGSSLEPHPDRSPSGRIADHCCPVCGLLFEPTEIKPGEFRRVSSGDIHRLYMDYQRRLSIEQAARPKPWNQ